MLFIAMVFLFFALLILARVFRGLQAVWLGLAMLAFGCSIVGLAGLTPRFSNYPAELLGLPLDQPVWAARVIKNLSLSNFVRLRLWSGVAFFVGVIGFAALYTQKKPESGHLGRRAGCAAFFLYLLLGYDPLMLLQLYKYGLRKAGIPGGGVSNGSSSF